MLITSPCSMRVKKTNLPQAKENNERKQDDSDVQLK